jgi:hypothetical protein
MEILSQPSDSSCLEFHETNQSLQIATAKSDAIEVAQPALDHGIERDRSVLPASSFT